MQPRRIAAGYRPVKDFSNHGCAVDVCTELAHSLTEFEAFTIVWESFGGAMHPLSMSQQLSRLTVAALFFLTGCTTTLIKDDVQHKTTSEAHCSGSEWADDSSLAVLPIPVVAFFVPHVDLHTLKADDYLKRCGDSTRLINRKVEAHKTACIPAALTRIISLGIWQWCPAHVSWEADLKA